MWQCSMPTDTCGTGQSKSFGTVRSGTYAKYADRSRADRTASVCLTLNFVEVFAMIQTAEDKVKEYRQCIRREIEHWKVINQNGCNDPFWSDGRNMNLVRNHIIYYQSKIHEACTENQLSLPEECYLSLPPEVDNNYMANFKQKPRVERLRQMGRITTGRVYQYDENQMSLF